MVSIQLILSDNKTDFITQFHPPIKLKGECEVALVNLETYYSIPNIKDGLNSFILENSKSGLKRKIEIPTGSYGLDAINKAIHTIFNFSGLIDVNEEYPVNITANYNTLKVIMEIQEGYIVDFSTGGLNKILGFESRKYRGVKGKIHESENVVNIIKVNSILVNLNICSGSYVKGQMGTTIYSFFPNVAPGYKIIERPAFPIYSPIILNDIHSIKTTLTDQNGDIIDLRGENLTLRLHIREKRI